MPCVSPIPKGFGVAEVRLLVLQALFRRPCPGRDHLIYRRWLLAAWAVVLPSQFNGTEGTGGNAFLARTAAEGVGRWL